MRSRDKLIEQFSSLYFLPHWSALNCRTTKKIIFQFIGSSQGVYCPLLLAVLQKVPRLLRHRCNKKTGSSREGRTGQKEEMKNTFRYANLMPSLSTEMVYDNIMKQ
jgi:hypothetical protein